MSTLAEATRVYQCAVEHVRKVREHGAVEQADEDALTDAIRELETAWLEAAAVR